MENIVSIVNSNASSIDYNGIDLIMHLMYSYTCIQPDRKYTHVWPELLFNDKMMPPATPYWSPLTQD